MATKNQTGLMGEKKVELYNLKQIVVFCWRRIGRLWRSWGRLRRIGHRNQAS
jgi:hypothetical protein